MFWPHEKIDDPRRRHRSSVKAFYEETPFPNYDDHDSVRSLIEKSRRGAYARRSIELDSLQQHRAGSRLRHRPIDKLSGHLLPAGHRHRYVPEFAAAGRAVSPRAWSESRAVRADESCSGPASSRSSSTSILCNGVLHHTADPYGGFRGLLPLLKPGGHIVIGLYNTYGRLMTDLRRSIFRLTGGRAKWIDPVPARGRPQRGQASRLVRRSVPPSARVEAHDRRSAGLVRDNGVEFVRGIPSVTPSGEPLKQGNLFERGKSGLGLGPPHGSSARDHYRE